MPSFPLLYTDTVRLPPLPVLRYAWFAREWFLLVTETLEHHSSTHYSFPALYAAGTAVSLPELQLFMIPMINLKPATLTDAFIPVQPAVL